MHSLIRKGFQTYSYDSICNSKDVLTEEEQTELAEWADEEMAKIVERSLKCAIHAVWWGMKEFVEMKTGKKCELPLQPPIPRSEFDRKATKNGNGKSVCFDLSPISEGLGDISLEDSEPGTFEAVDEKEQTELGRIDETRMEIDTKEKERRRKGKRDLEDLEDFLDGYEETTRAKRSKRKE